jgi:lysophospholipase L1-like esterase
VKKKVAFAIFTFVVVLLLLETAARLLEKKLGTEALRHIGHPGWQAEFFATLFDWHEPDPDLLWRFRANLHNPLIQTNSQHLIGDEVSVKKLPNTFRILLLGDSSPVGLGLQSWEQTFGALLKRLLETQCSTRKNVEIINAAVSGYTSEQIVRFLELRGWEYEPDLVILYCGNNDASISGALSDQELLQRQHLKAIRQLFCKLAFYRALRAVLTKYLVTESTPSTSLKPRVTPERFGDNLERIARDCRRHDCPLIVLKPPVPYLWPAGLQFKVFRHVTGEGGRLILPQEMARILGREIKYCLNDSLFKQLYGQGDKFTRVVYRTAYNDTLTPSQAIRYYTDLLKRNENDPVILNNLGVSYWEDGRFREADRYLRMARKAFLRNTKGNMEPSLVASGAPFLFNIGVNLLSLNKSGTALIEDTNSLAFIYLDSALQADYFSLRIKRSYWRQIDRLKRQPDVIVVDLPLLFRENGRESLFIDHCHPTAKGHRLIAQELFRIICERFGAQL